MMAQAGTSAPIPGKQNITNNASLTWIGVVIVIVLLMFFIRTRVVTVFLGVILLGLLLINYKNIVPAIFKNYTL